MHIKTATSIEKRRIIEHPSPSLLTTIGWEKTHVYKNHGNGNPTVTSKMLLPTDDETAISPKPFLATITLVIRSGIEVPAAKNVKPMTSGGRPTVSPVIVAHQTIRYEKTAIQSMLPTKVIAKNFLAEKKIIKIKYN